MATWLNETSFPYGNGSHFRLRLYYNLSQNIAGNYSDVTFYLYFASVDGYSGSGASSNGYVNDNWVGSTTSVGRNAEVYLGSRTDRYYHNNDGTGSAGYSASISCPWGIGTASLSGTLSLPTIPRASNITNQILTINEQKTISWSRATDNFVHTLKYTFGNASGTIGNNLSTSVNWTPPDNLYQQLGNKQGNGILSLETYNNGVLLGTTTSILTLKANESECRPVKTKFDVIDTNNITVNLTDDNTVFIKNVSNAKVNFKFNTLKYAVLSVMKINGVALSNITPTSSDEGTTNYEVEYTINGINTNNVDIYIKDSRGIEYIDTKALDMIDYIPVSANVSAKRKQPTTGEIQTQFTGNYFNDSFGASNNQLTIMYKYKRVDEQGYSNYITLTENTDYTIENNTFFSGNYSSEYPIVLSPSFDYRYDYEIVIEFSDLLTSASKTLTVIKGIPIIQWNKTKFQVNGDLYVADNTGSNPRQITDLDIYSSNEIRVGTWISGEPLYRKVIDIGTLPSSAGSKTIYTGLDFHNACVCRKLYGMVVNPDNGVSLPLPFASTTVSSIISINIDANSNILITVGVDRSSVSGYAVIEYTKNID